MLAPLSTASDILLAALIKFSDLLAPTESWINASLNLDPITFTNRHKIKFTVIVTETNDQSVKSIRTSYDYITTLLTTQITTTAAQMQVSSTTKKDDK